MNNVKIIVSVALSVGTAFGVLASAPNVTTQAATKYNPIWYKSGSKYGPKTLKNGKCWVDYNRVGENIWNNAISSAVSGASGLGNLPKGH